MSDCPTDKEIIAKTNEWLDCLFDVKACYDPWPVSRDFLASLDSRGCGVMRDAACRYEPPSPKQEKTE